MNVDFFHAFFLRTIYLVHLPIIKQDSLFVFFFAVDLHSLYISNNNLLRKVDWPVFSSVECPFILLVAPSAMQELLSLMNTMCLVLFLYRGFLILEGVSLDV